MIKLFRSPLAPPPLAENLAEDVVESLSETAQFILSCQREDGAIGWFQAGKLDPWDHVEAAMALTVAGYYREALSAYTWLQQHQRADGSWLAFYFDTVPSSWNEQGGQQAPRIESNFVAYCATGLWHYGCVTKDWQSCTQLFPMVEAAIRFVLDLQSQDGEIQWAVAEGGGHSIARDALITGCSSILRSLECAIALAKQLGRDKPEWLGAYHKLAEALLHKPWRFDRTWESKARYSMDWFYPVLSGALSPTESALRLERKWTEFVERGLGCRCVSDEPWITIAESCELVMALVAAGERQKAETVHAWLDRWRDVDGSFWTGFNFRDHVIWPREKTSWTAAAYLLATDALYQLTPGAHLFTEPSHLLFAQQGQ